MSGYYDYHPLVHLDRHFVLAGYFGAETRQIGFQLAALTGLGVNDLERTIEHFAGQSTWNLLADHGEAHYRRLEKHHLHRLLDAHPRQIITLGDGTLMASANRRKVLEDADLVVLDLDLASCFWRIWKGSSTTAKPWHPLYPEPVEQMEQVRPFHDLRRRGFATAKHRIDVSQRRRGEVVEQLIEILG